MGVSRRRLRRRLAGQRRQRCRCSPRTTSRAAGRLYDLWPLLSCSDGALRVAGQRWRAGGCGHTPASAAGRLAACTVLRQFNSPQSTGNNGGFTRQTLHAQPMQALEAALQGERAFDRPDRALDRH